MSGPAWTHWVPCALCGSGDLAVLFAAARSGRQVVRCRTCRLVFYDPQPTAADLDQIYSADYFTDEYPAAGRPARRAAWDLRLARLECLVSVGTLLDIGSGVGEFLGVAQERGWKAVGLDVAPAGAETAAASGMTVLTGELTRPRPPGVPAFDVITLWDVLEHMLDPVRALAGAPAWLAAGGVLVIQTQNVDSADFAWMRRRWGQFVDAHLYHFSPSTLRRALERAGARTVHVTGAHEFLGTSSAAAPGLRGRLARLRDRALRAAGWDPFSLMIATARFDS